MGSKYWSKLTITEKQRLIFAYQSFQKIPHTPTKTHWSRVSFGNVSLPPAILLFPTHL